MLTEKQVNRLFRKMERFENILDPLLFKKVDNGGEQVCKDHSHKDRGQYFGKGIKDTGNNIEMIDYIEKQDDRTTGDKGCQSLRQMLMFIIKIHFCEPLLV